MISASLVLPTDIDPEQAVSLTMSRTMTDGSVTGHNPIFVGQAAGRSLAALITSMVGMSANIMSDGLAAQFGKVAVAGTSTTERIDITYPEVVLPVSGVEIVSWRLSYYSAVDGFVSVPFAGGVALGFQITLSDALWRSLAALRSIT